MKYSKILGAFVLLSLAALFVPESHRVIACSGSSGSVCTVTTTTCLKSMVMAKSTPGVVLLPPLTQVMFNVPINLFVIANPPAPGCGPCMMPVTPTSAKIEIELVSLSLQSVAATTISTANATMGLPVASPAGSFNSYMVPMTVPAGTATGLYQAMAKATVNWSDGSSISQSGNTVVCLVDPAPGNPGVPRLDVQLLSPASPRLAGGDQHRATYRITNNDPVNSVTLTAFATGKQISVRPQGQSERQGVFAISNPFGDDFPIAFGPAPCLPLPGHPFTQPEIMMPIPPIAPNSFFDVFVDIRSYGMCASGSCAESTLRVQGNFADNTNAFGCAAMHLYVDSSQPTTTCLPRTDDCNGNGIPDALDIAQSTAPDQNYNAVIDQCEAGNAPIIPNPGQINPPTVSPGQPISVMVIALPDFGMPTTHVITSVLANGNSLSSGDAIHWQGTIPADTRPGPQTVYFLAKENNGAIATHIGFYNVQPAPLMPTAAVSRKAHPGAGTFAINLPLSGSPGVECRSGGTGHTIVVTFNNPVVSGNAAVTTGTGTVAGAPLFSGISNTMTVNLAGVPDVQMITLTLSNVMDSFGQTLPSVAVNMNVLAGDTNGNKTVNASDVSQTKTQVGMAVNASNFRQDVNVNGSINAGDVSLVKTRVGNGLP